MFVAVALLLNPFLPIRMQRAQWQPIDLCLGILLIGWSGYWLFRGTKDQGRQQANSQAPRLGQSVSPGHLDWRFILWAFYWLWIPLLFFCLSKVLPGHIFDAIAKIMIVAWAVIFGLVPVVGFIVSLIVEVVNYVKSATTKLTAVRRVLPVVAVPVALVVAGTVMRWTLEKCRAHIHPFVSSLTMMVVFTGALARFVSKRPYRNKVKVIWLGLVCYLCFMLLLSFDVVRDKFGQRYVPGYYSYYSDSYYSDNDDCEGASPDDGCGDVYTYRVSGHLSPTIEGLGLLYMAACIACPWAAYRLWQFEAHQAKPQ